MGRRCECLFYSDRFENEGKYEKWNLRACGFCWLCLQEKKILYNLVFFCSNSYRLKILHALFLGRIRSIRDIGVFVASYLRKAGPLQDEVNTNIKPLILVGVLLV